MTAAENQVTTHEAQIDNSARATLAPNEEFVAYMGTGWAPLQTAEITAWEVAPFAKQRRDAVSAAFAGQRVVVAAGIMKQRANDTFYMFRADSAFSHLTGWGAAAQPGAVLVFEPATAGEGDHSHHNVTLYFAAAAGRDSAEFFTNSETGEFWIGPTPSLQDVAAQLQLQTADLAEFTPGDADVTLEDAELGQFLDELRIVKDEFEISQMEAAVAATARGFHEVVAGLDEAIAAERGERVVEVMFHKHARVEGNWEGYDTIAAAGDHACTLHWVQNTGAVKPGDLLLLDAGVEVDSLYTADITRTLPISGEFTAVQRRVYEAVLEAADAAFAVVRPGITFHEVHDTALAVIEKHVKEWGFWPADAKPEVPYHRRYMVHGTSHHLGLDVHDCARARREMYYDRVLEPGMVFTIEPGLYFHPGDTTVPQELWGIGVRIEDDIVVTETGAVNLSADIPRTVADVEAWVKRQG